eukprot:m.346421 g.346421  ORF g.346421 m.346421 type:complete len:442 (-) comp29032_c0_seq1:113-1438(-)
MYFLLASCTAVKSIQLQEGSSTSYVNNSKVQRLKPFWMHELDALAISDFVLPGNEATVHIVGVSNYAATPKDIYRMEPSRTLPVVTLVGSCSYELCSTTLDAIFVQVGKWLIVVFRSEQTPRILDLTLRNISDKDFKNVSILPGKGIPIPISNTSFFLCRQETDEKICMIRIFNISEEGIVKQIFVTKPSTLANTTCQFQNNPIKSNSLVEGHTTSLVSLQTKDWDWDEYYTIDVPNNEKTPSFSFLTRWNNNDRSKLNLIMDSVYYTERDQSLGPLRVVKQKFKAVGTSDTLFNISLKQFYTYPDGIHASVPSGNMLLYSQIEDTVVLDSNGKVLDDSKISLYGLNFLQSDMITPGWYFNNPQYGITEVNFTYVNPSGQAKEYILELPKTCETLMGNCELGDHAYTVKINATDVICLGGVESADRDTGPYGAFVCYKLDI